MQALGRTVSAAELPGAARAELQLVLWPATLEAAWEVTDEAAGRHLECLDAGPDLEDLVDRLPPELRQVIQRRFGLDGPPVNRRDLAIELGISEPTVRRLEGKGLQSLRRVLVRLAAA
jgi:DNA-directed RNA polymerase sigma subunit (sigma70/sigma32)